MTQQQGQLDEREKGNDVRQLDVWLLSGGWVVASSERAARFVEAEFHRARLHEGLKAWAEPTILTWPGFVRRAWDQIQTADDRMVLSAAQELQIWESIAAESKSAATLLPGPRHKLASLAAEAYRLLASYAPSALDKRARSGWQRDAEEMSVWLAAFEERSNRERLLSANLMPIELLKFLRRGETTKKHDEARPALRLVGFDRLEPMQKELLAAFGKYELVEEHGGATSACYFEAPDLSAELAACVLWCNRKLKANPAARILVISSEVGERRGEIERAFVRWSENGRSPAIEFSLGRPMNRIPLMQAAELMLRWLTGPLNEHEVDWLLSTGCAAESAEENAELQRLMRSLRRAQRERPVWSLNDFCRVAREFVARNAAEVPASPLKGWIARAHGVQARLRDVAGAKLNVKKSPLEWSLLSRELLALANWPGFRTLASAEEQARINFEQMVEDLSTLGFDGRRIEWSAFTELLRQSLAENLFAPESREAPILIVGPSESAGLSADGIWFLGAQEGSWPVTGTTNPLIPVGLQRDAGMPHATVELDWELARRMTERMLRTAADVCFSFARLCGDEESKPSRLIEKRVGTARDLPEELVVSKIQHVKTVFVDEIRTIPYQLPFVRGGAQSLTLQSNCPFKAYATRRLGAESWCDAEVGLNALQRGNLLHQLMRSVWSGPEQGGLKRLDDLRKLVDAASDSATNDGVLENFVQKHARRVVDAELETELRNRLSPIYLELEVERLTRLASAWLRYEAAREEFEVVALEAKRTVNVAGVALDLRIDRVDRLKDGSLLIVDYKTGDVKPRLWELPRPEDVQLPLYACLGVHDAFESEGVSAEARERLGGLVFGKISAREQKFAGHVRNADETLIASLKNTDALKKNLLTPEMLYDWRDEIEKLAHEFVLGDAEVDPRDPPRTCERCDLQVLCRVQESAVRGNEDAENDEGAGDE